jgi:hypothetical protein
MGVLLLPVLSLASGSVMFVPLFALPAMFILSGMLFGRGDSPPDRPDGEDGGGGGPRRPDRPPDPPSAGPPLSDADQWRGRVRDHNRPRFDSARVRRGAPRHPDRTPARTPHRS